MGDPVILVRVRQAAAARILYLPHAVRQMSKPTPMISTADIRNVVLAGEAIEDYPEDVRGHSCLLLGSDAHGRTIHVVCSPKEDFLAVITAYVPDPAKWTSDFRARKRP